MKKRFLIPIFVIVALITGLFLGTIGSAATYNQPLYSTTVSTDLQKDAANQRNGGQVYYVDGNKVSDGDGTSWSEAYNDLASAITASHANIALAGNRVWAARNIIYVRGDRLDEDLTVFPQKTDIIGVGSCDAYKGAGIIGNHAPTTTAMGTRFYNINFFPGADGDLVTLTSATSGMEFHNCQFVGVWSAKTAPSAIDMTGHPMAKIIGCVFRGAFGTAVIDLGAGDISGLEIRGNTIIGGADNGIQATGTVTGVGVLGLGLIADNYIQVADLTIDDGSDNALIIIGNRCISAEASAGAAYVIDDGLAADNIVTYNDGTSINVPVTAD